VAGRVEDEVGGVGGIGIDAAVGRWHDGPVRRDRSVGRVQRRHRRLRFSIGPQRRGVCTVVVQHSTNSSREWEARVFHLMLFG